MLKTITVCFLVFTSCFLFAQPDSTADQDEAMAYLIEASQAIDPIRYKDVRGTPYRYKDFGPMTIYDATLNEYPLERANLNGFTSQV
jgi:hypothetical protein